MVDAVKGGGGEDSPPSETLGKAELQLAGSGITADITVWPGGNTYSAGIVVTNTGTTPTTNWEVDVQLNNSSLTGAPSNATAMQSGNIVTLRPLASSNNFVLQPGAATYPGINGVWTSSPYVNPTIVAVRRDVSASGTGGSSTGGASTGGTATGGSAIGGTINSGGAAVSAGSGSSAATTGGAGGTIGNNVAQDKPATASSSLSGNPASYGNDASSTTSWCAASSSVNEWWSVDLGAEYALTGTEVTWPYSGRVYQYAISLSSDGTNFVEVVNQRGNTRTTQTQTDSFTAQGRYLKLQVTGLATSPATSVCISDFKAFGTFVSSSGAGGGTGTASSSGGTTLSGTGGSATSSGGSQVFGGGFNLGGTSSISGGATATGGAGVSGSAGSVVETEEFYIDLPRDLRTDQVTLATYGEGGSLVINDATKLVGASSGYVNVSSLSTNGQTELGVNSELNDLYSASNVFVRGSHVHGNLTTAGALIPAPQVATQIDGTTSEHASLDPIRRLSWTIRFTSSAEPVTLGDTESRSIAPGAFGGINLAPNAQLTLSQPGIYVVNGSLIMEPGSVIAAPNSAYHVELYVRGDFIYRGTIQKAAASSNVIIGVAGSGDIPIERPLDAILVAPHASVQLGTVDSGHRTSIYAKSILARPNSTITQGPFIPNSLCGEGDARIGLCAHNCAADGDCAPGLACTNGVCGCSASGTASCGAREPCSDNSDCQPGLICANDARSRYGVSWDRACMPISCTTHGADSPDCGSPDSPCGICPACERVGGCVPTLRSSFSLDNVVDTDGAADGSFAVSESGTATYSIPLPLPPGRGNMTPALSLEYDSSAREELFGEGWHVSGFSYVARCVSPATPAGRSRAYLELDYRRGVRGNDDDRLCLDGQQLARQPALDGADGSRGYTTANDSFKRIRAYGGTGANADYLKVWTPEGRILTYGSPTKTGSTGKETRNANVYMNLVPETTRVWALSKIEDQVGNFITYTYGKTDGGMNGKGSSVCNSSPEECGTTEIWPETIEYTGFANSLGAVVHAPNRKVHFGYDNASSPPARIVGYTAGVKSIRSQLLNRIDVSIDGENIRTFWIDNQTTDDGVYEVRSIRDCFEVSPEQFQCRRPTVFEYNTGSGLGPAIDTGVTLNPSQESLPGAQFIVWDADGDGKDDLITAEGTYKASADDGSDQGQWVQISVTPNADGSLAFGKTTLGFYQFDGAIEHSRGKYRDTYREFGQASIFDVDGDGFDDLMDVAGHRQEDGEALRGGNYSPGTTVKTTSGPGRDKLQFPDNEEYQAFGKKAPTHTFIDVDGDGLSDLVRFQNDTDGYVLWRRNLGRGLFEPTQLLTDMVDNPARLFPIDLDGDGAADLVKQTGDFSTNSVVANWVQKPQISLFSIPVGLDTALGDPAPEVALIDINGDGLKDALVRVAPSDNINGPGDMPLHVNTGKSVTSRIPTNTKTQKLDRAEFKSINVLDYDGDGREDALFWAKDHWVLLRGGGTTLARIDLAELPEPLTTPGMFSHIYTDTKTGTPMVWWMKHVWSAVADLNGDGANDLLVVGKNKKLYYHLARTAQTHMLKSVTDGLGERTEVYYDTGRPGYHAYTTSSTRSANTTSGGVIVQDRTRVLNRVSRPLVAFEYARHFVGDIRDESQRANPDNFVTDRFSRYYNSDARVDYAGRGWIGFDDRYIVHHDGAGQEIASVHVTYDKNSVIVEPPSLIDIPPGSSDTSDYGEVDPSRYPYAGVPTQIETYHPTVATDLAQGGRRRLHTVESYDWSHFAPPGAPSTTGRRFFLRLLGKTTVTENIVPFAADDQLVSKVEETFGHDSAGNVTLHDVWTYNGANPVEHVVEESVFATPDSERWLLRIPQNLTVKRARSDNAAASSKDDFTGEESQRSVTWEHDALGQLTNTIRGGEALETKTLRNSIGNVYRTEVAAAGVVTRVTEVNEFDSQELFPTKTTTQPNVASEVDSGDVPLVPHVSTFDYDQRFGEVTSSTVVIGSAGQTVTETWRYDAFGQLERHTRTDGGGETISRAAASYDATGVLPVAPVLMTTVVVDGGGKSTEEVDSLGRVVRKCQVSIDKAPIGGRTSNKDVVQEFSYDAAGRLEKTSRPHVRGDTTQGAISYLYNELDDIETIVAPDRTLHYEQIEVPSMDPSLRASLDLGQHDAYVLRRTDILGNMETRVFDLSGRLTTSIAADNGRVTYEYDGFGDLRFVHGPDGTTERTYDSVGRLRTENDPDRGLHEFTYYGSDQPKTHTSPGLNGNSTRLTETFFYDPFGRLKRLENSDGVRRWQYDQAEYGIGQLSAELVDAGGIASSANSTSYTYDSSGRMKSSTQRVGAKEHSISVDYTSDGRVQVITYPSIGNVGFRVEHVYDLQSGMLLEVRDFDQQANRYWRLEETYQGYLPRVEHIGNAVTTTRAYFAHSGLPYTIQSHVDGSLIQSETYYFDPNRRLESRENVLRPGSRQNFQYDALNRLHKVLDSHGIPTEQIDYDPQGTGNITFKTGIGVYTYSDTSLAHPHAVRSVDSGRIFGYDDAGNQISRQNGTTFTQSLKYSLFGLPYEITTQAPSSAKVTALEYGANGQRIFKQHFALASPSDPASARILEDFRIYFGNLYEYRGTCVGGSDTTCADPALTHVYRVYGGGREVAQVHRDETAGLVTGQRTYFLHVDQLGSTALITAGGDNTSGAPAEGTVLKDLQYTPFGKSSTTTDNAPNVYTGFTGLEEDTSEGLVNANGRLYDPEIGRFLSPDPTNPFMDWTQGLNLYSYALNNPLGFIDPSGFEPEPVTPEQRAYENTMGNPTKWQEWQRKDWAKNDHPITGAKKMRNNPGGGGTVKGGVLNGGTPPAGKVRPDTGAPGSGARGTSPQPGTGAANHGSDDPSRGAQEAAANALRKNPNRGPANSIMDGLTFVGGLANFMTPKDKAQGGGIPGGHCQGPDCVSGGVVQGVWLTAVMFGSQIVGKAVASFQAIKAAAAEGKVLASKAVDSAIERVTRLVRGPGASGGANTVRTALQGLGAGKNAGVRVARSAEELQALFGRLSSGGKLVEGSSYPGKLIELGDKTTIGLRAASKSGGPTIDITLPGGKLWKVHVE